MTQATLEKFFNGPRTEETLEPVVLIPWSDYTSSTIDISSTGYTWSDFEYIEFVSKQISNVKAYKPDILPKYIITQNPKSWSLQMGYNDASTNYTLVVTATGDETATVVYTTPSVAVLGAVVGYRRRFSATNLSGIVTELLTQAGYAPRIPTELYNDTAQASSLTLSDALENYDELVFYASWSIGGTTTYHEPPTTIQVSDIVNASATNLYSIFRQTASNDTYYAEVRVSSASGTSITLQSVSDTWSIDGVYKVIGIKYGV